MECAVFTPLSLHGNTLQSEERPVPWGAWQMISDVPLTPPHLVKKGTPMRSSSDRWRAHTSPFLSIPPVHRGTVVLSMLWQSATQLSWTSRSSTLGTMNLQHVVQNFKKKKQQLQKAIRPPIFPLFSTLNLCTITQMDKILHKIRSRVRNNVIVFSCALFFHIVWMTINLGLKRFSRLEQRHHPWVFVKYHYKVTLMPFTRLLSQWFWEMFSIIKNYWNYLFVPWTLDVLCFEILNFLWKRASVLQ